jgi:tRNA (guanine37-N1)-methyltransferase
MKSKGILVELKKAEEVRRFLIEKNLMKKDLKIKKDSKFISIPIEKNTKELAVYEIIESDFEEIKREPKSYKDIISIPKNLKHELPTSYDIIGKIILIKLSKNLLIYKKEIGAALLKTNKSIKSVCLTYPVEGELRIRDLIVIAGENQTITTHKEHSLKYQVDVSKTYFSPRLATERLRISYLIKKDEIVVDMFAGVAPFSIMIAKYAKPKIIYAVDKNKDAIEYAQKNIKENNLLDKIEVIHSDAKNIEKILEKRGEKANRIIMNLPFSSYLFFRYALKIIANSAIIHYYDILNEEMIESRIEELKRIAEKEKIILKNLNIRKIKSYAPREFYIVIDITATRNMPM